MFSYTCAINLSIRETCWGFVVVVGGGGFGFFLVILVLKRLVTSYAGQCNT